jgi:hypothetical protein
MPSDPSPATDHFASFELEVAEDKRLSEAQRRLMGVTSRRVRAGFLGSPELMQMYVVNVLRAQAEVMGLGTAKRLMAIDLFNRTMDGMNRIAHRFGKGREVPAKRGRGSPLWAKFPRGGGPEVQDEHDEQAGEPAGVEDNGGNEAAGGG